MPDDAVHPHHGLTRRQKSWLTVVVVGIWALLAVGAIGAGIGGAYQMLTDSKPKLLVVAAALVAGWFFHSLTAIIYFTQMPGLGGVPDE